MKSHLIDFLVFTCAGVVAGLIVAKIVSDQARRELSTSQPQWLTTVLGSL